MRIYKLYYFKYYYWGAGPYRYEIPISYTDYDEYNSINVSQQFHNLLICVGA